MSSREELLSLIERLNNEEVSEKLYGKNWILQNWGTRRSHAAGKLCLTIEKLYKAEAKASRRPGSIGARKARQKAKRERRRIIELKRIIAEKYTNYHPEKPEYPYLKILDYGHASKLDFRKHTQEGKNLFAIT